jgi:hypothetical protein
VGEEVVRQEEGMEEKKAGARLIGRRRSNCGGRRGTLAVIGPIA